VTGLEDWEVEFYADESGREPCRAWMGTLTPRKRIALEEAIRLVLARRGLAVVEAEFGEALGGGLYEFGCDGRQPRSSARSKVFSLTLRPKAEKIMLRAFFCTSGRKIILLLSGYDKARDPGKTRQDKGSPRRESSSRRMRRPSVAARADGTEAQLTGICVMTHTTE
jgi:hypothetical protein